MRKEGSILRRNRLLRALAIGGVLISFAGVVEGQQEGSDPPRGILRLAQNPAGETKKSPVVKDFAAPTKKSAFKPPKISSTDLLATGDQPVLVKLSSGTYENWRLVRLEKSWVILRKDPLAEPTLTNAASKTIAEIRTTDKKFEWKLGKDGKSFEGKVQPSPATESISVVPQPGNRHQVEQFLLLSFRRMVNRAIDGVADAPSPSDVAEVRRLAAKRGEALVRGGFNGAIADLYAALPKVLDIVAAQVAVQDRLIAEYNEKIKAQMVERRKIADRQAMAGMIGMVKMFAGAMPNTEVVRDFGRTYIIDRGPVSPDLMASGLRDLAGAQMTGASQMAMLDNIKQMTDEKQQEAMQASLTVQMEATSGLRAKFEEVASGAYQIPKANPIPQEEWAKPRKVRADYQPLIDRLDDICEREKEILGRTNPFAQLDLLFFQSLVPVIDAGDRLNFWQDQARKAIKLAGEFPDDPILDYDRAELLTTGAELALRAAEVELGSYRWAHSYHPRAEFAGKVLDVALKFLPEDPSGRIREKKAQALLLGGQVNDALKLAEEIREIRKDLPRYRFQLARIECAAGQTDKGLDDLEAAIIPLGFADIEEVRTRGGDFPKAEKRFKELTEINVSFDGKIPFGYNPTGPRIVVTNRSRFALTDVLIDLEYFTIVGRGNPPPTKKQEYVQKVARLDPNESMIVSLGKVGQVRQTDNKSIYGRVQVFSRQGTSKIYPSH
jgi:hypothetical protein